MHKKMFHPVAMALSLFLLVGVFGTPASAVGAEIVKFRLNRWSVSHFNDAQVATAHYQTLKQIGCEAKQHQHGSHFDVSYRCPQWRSISFKNHAEAHKMEIWLKSLAFETMHQH